MEIEIYCQNLRDYRKNRKLSQEKLADILGVSRQTIFSLETGKSIPSLDLAYKISSLFDIAIDQMFFREIDNIHNKLIKDAVVDSNQYNLNRGNMEKELLPLSPFHGLGDLHREIDRFFDDSFTVARGSSQSLPALNVHENEKNYSIELAVPGYINDDIDIEVYEDYLTIRGEKKEKDSEREKGYVRKEFSHNQFERSVSFPQKIDSENTLAKLESGILEITAPKIAPVKPKVKTLKPTNI